MHCETQPTFAAVTIYSMEGAAGLGGRLLFGVAVDRLGAKRVLIAGLVIQAVVAPAYLLGLLMGIKSELAAIGAVQREHARRLDRLESARMPLRAVE